MNYQVPSTLNFVKSTACAFPSNNLRKSCFCVLIMTDEYIIMVIERCSIWYNSSITCLLLFLQCSAISLVFTFMIVYFVGLVHFYIHSLLSGQHSRYLVFHYLPCILHTDQHCHQDSQTFVYLPLFICTLYGIVINTVILLFICLVHLHINE